MKRFCEKCSSMVDTTTVSKRESYNVMGETVEVDAEVLICAQCGEELFSEELDSNTLREVYNIYRTRHKQLFSDEWTLPTAKDEEFLLQ